MLRAWRTLNSSQLSTQNPRVVVNGDRTASVVSTRRCTAGSLSGLYCTGVPVLQVRQASTFVSATSCLRSTVLHRLLCGSMMITVVARPHRLCRCLLLCLQWPDGVLGANCPCFEL